MSFDSLPAHSLMSFLEPLLSSNAASHSVPFADAKMGDIMNRSDLKSMVPQPKSYKKGPFTVEATGYEKKDGETIPRRHPLAKDKLILTPASDVNTVYDILRRSANKFGNAKALGYRKLITTHEEVKQIKKVVDGKETTQDKKWTYFELSGYHYISFSEYEKLALKVGAGFRALGMKAEDRVHIFAATSPWWLAIAHGIEINEPPFKAETDNHKQAPALNPCPSSPPTTLSEKKASSTPSNKPTQRPSSSTLTSSPSSSPLSRRATRSRFNTSSTTVTPTSNRPTLTSSSLHTLTCPSRALMNL